MGQEEDRAARVAEITAKRALEAKEREAVKRRIAEDAAERRAKATSSRGGASGAAAPAPAAPASAPAAAAGGTSCALRVALEDGRVLRGVFAATDTLLTGTWARPDARRTRRSARNHVLSAAEWVSVCCLVSLTRRGLSFAPLNFAVRNWVASQLASLPPPPPPAAPPLPAGARGLRSGGGFAFAPPQRGGAFTGTPRTVAEDGAALAARAELLAAARASHAAHTARLRGEAAALARPPPAAAPPPHAPPPADDISFVAPFPPPAVTYEGDAVLGATTLASAGLVPQGALNALTSRTRGRGATLATAPPRTGAGGAAQAEEPEDDYGDDDDEMYDDEAEEGEMDEGEGEEAPVVGHRLGGGGALAPAAGGREAAAAAAAARFEAAAAAAALAAAARAAAPAQPLPTEANRPPRLPPPPPPPLQRKEPAVPNDAALAAALARAAAAAAGSAQPGLPLHHSSASAAWKSPEAVAAQQAAARAAAAAERAAAAVRRDAVRRILEEDKALRRFRLASAQARPPPQPHTADAAAPRPPPVALTSLVRVKVVREDGSAVSLRLPAATPLSTLVAAAAHGFAPPAASSASAAPPCETYGLVAPGGGVASTSGSPLHATSTEWFGAAALARPLADAVTCVDGTILRLMRAAMRGAQARGQAGARPPAAPRNRALPPPVVRRGADAGEEEEEDDDGGDDDDGDEGDDAGGGGGFDIDDPMDAVGGGDLTYEQAIALGERIGVVAVGTSRARVAALSTAPVPAPPPPAPGADGGGAAPDRCAICQHDLDVGQMATSLPCGHALHAACAADWLARAHWCPLCKRGV